MARPRKGEKLKGITLPCRFCGIKIYRSPSQIVNPTSFCHQACYVKNAFSFPCNVCSKPVFTQPAQLKYRARSTCSPQCRRILRRQQAEHRRIHYGYTKHQIDRLARYSIEAELWRMDVFKRDDYTCQMCRTRGGYIEADHIKPWAYFPELRFELSNGRTLCRKCHNQTKVSYKVMRQLYEKREATPKKEQNSFSKIKATTLGGV
jgi:5-methylcytosine-specific restriction endonuclease McrA